MTSAIESRSTEPLKRLDALFNELANTVAKTPKGIKAKCDIIASEFADFSDDFIADAALGVLQRDIPAVLAALRGRLES